MNPLIIPARCALAELIGLYESGDLPLECQLKTIVELYDALIEVGEDVRTYDAQVQLVMEELDDDDDD